MKKHLTIVLDTEHLDYESIRETIQLSQMTVGLSHGNELSRLEAIEAAEDMCEVKTALSKPRFN
jgi:hypothetical protein